MVGNSSVEWTVCKGVGKDMYYGGGSMPPIHRTVRKGHNSVAVRLELPLLRRSWTNLIAKLYEHWWQLISFWRLKLK